MVRIDRDIFLKLIEEGYFDQAKDMSGILRTLNQRGFTVKGKKVGRIAQTLTFLCRDQKLVRDEVPENEKRTHGRWFYRRYSR
jgi:hypothetical protein